MAMVYTFSTVGKILTGVAQPIIYCVSDAELEAEAVSIGKSLAEKLIKCNVKMRSIRMEQIFLEAINNLPDNVLVKDIDVLFHPAYQIDVLAVLKNACRKKPFRLLWSGTYRDGKLIYAEEGFADYKTYNLNQYDITCII